VSAASSTYAAVGETDASSVASEVSTNACGFRMPIDALYRRTKKSPMWDPTASFNLSGIRHLEDVWILPPRNEQCKI
jgi:hypothetical protein